MCLHVLEMPDISHNFVNFGSIETIERTRTKVSLRRGFLLRNVTNDTSQSEFLSFHFLKL